jgi:heme iron utilization protein
LPAKTNLARPFCSNAPAPAGSSTGFKRDAAAPSSLAGGMSEIPPRQAPARFARRLMRSRGRAALATSLGGAPYASLVLVAAELDASPLLLLSDLAQHSRNIAIDPRVSLLLDATEGRPDPLAGPRLSLLGRAEAIADPRRLARFAARHPTSAVYAGFADFRLYRLAVERGHLVAGFGRIEWIDGRDLLLANDFDALAAAEPEILRQVDGGRPGTADLFARSQLGLAGSGWRMTGIDPEGADLRREDEAARLDFAEPVPTPEAARAVLRRLAGAARAIGEL